MSHYQPVTFKNKQGTHSFEGAAAGQPVGVERFWTVLTRRDQAGQNITGILVVTAAQLLHARNLDPETCNVLLQRDVELRKRRRKKPQSNREGRKE